MCAVNSYIVSMEYHFCLPASLLYTNNFFRGPVGQRPNQSLCCGLCVMRSTSSALCSVNCFVAGHRTELSEVEHVIWFRYSICVVCSVVVLMCALSYNN